MDNFFKFIDTLNESILALYDKSFFYMNQYLLSTLRYTDKNRPVSLKHIIDSKWLQTLKKLSEDDSTTIILKIKNGEEKKYTAQMFPFQLKHSYCHCYILRPKEEIDQEFITINWLAQKLPFPVIVFDKVDNTFQTNDSFDTEIEAKIQNIGDLSNQFSINTGLDFSKQDNYSFPSTNTSKKILHLVQHSTKTFYTFRIGIIQLQNELGESADLSGLKQSFDQSIKKLEQLNGNETKFSHINSPEIAEEIDTLKNLFKDFELGVPQGDVKINQIDLSEIVSNELEILKSNDFFREKITLQTELEACTATFKGAFSTGIETIKAIVDQAAKEICIQKLKCIVFKIFEMEDKVYLQIIGDRNNNEQDTLTQNIDANNSSQTIESINNEIQNYQDQLQNMDVQVSLDGEFKEYFDLTLTLKKN